MPSLHRSSNGSTLMKVHTVCNRNSLCNPSLLPQACLVIPSCVHRCRVIFISISLTCSINSTYLLKAFIPKQDRVCTKQPSFTIIHWLLLIKQCCLKQQ